MTKWESFRYTDGDSKRSHEVWAKFPFLDIEISWSAELFSDGIWRVGVQCSILGVSNR